ncbi:transposase [Bifidobacterium pseudolongum subsp. globosum]|nr:transposase [Bifidobacterium pseudolongum subsp. globosum]
MISMSVVHSIRSMRKEGCSVAAMARELNVSEPTVRKYLKVRDLSPKPPVKRARPSKIEQWVPLIEQWLAEDRESWSKQRHTATRIHERLVHEHGADVSLSTVNRKVGELKRQFRLERESGFLDLSWHEAEAQADFGQTDVWWRGVRTRMRFFVLSFPYSNTTVACLTPGENAECTCAALRGLFERLEGVPRRIVFDNAAGVGHKRKDGGVRYTELFAAFRAHYGFDSTLCNPYSGHEKGNVEAKVGAIRRALFVPVPKAYGYESFNADLFERCMAMADKYGAVTLEGRHRYFTGIEHAGRELIVGLRADSVEILDTTGKPIGMHERAYGDAPTSSDDPVNQLEALVFRANAWPNSKVRDALPDPLRSWLDQQGRIELQGHLRTMLAVSRDTGWRTAIDAMGDVLSATGTLDAASVELQAARLRAGNEPIVYDEPVDLSEYDIAFSDLHH